MPCWEYRWANEQGVSGMPVPEVLEAEGYVRVCQHPFWPLSWLMRRESNGPA
jgi:hypothetical protein